MDARPIPRTGKISSTYDLGATLAHHSWSATKSGAQIEIGRHLVEDLGATLHHRRSSRQRLAPRSFGKA